MVKYVFGIIFIAAGLFLLYSGARRASTLRRCREAVDGRYLDRESVGSFRGEKFRLKFEYEYGGKIYTALSDGKLSEDEILKRGFTRGRRYALLISPDDPAFCTCRLKNEYVFEATFMLMAGIFITAIGAMLLI
ncbi:MAG: DUF3592 domain-containing protein [Firmicutes bacterium]|nr:DUF3592 domain-containing protein [Bacillota bacterium]